MAPHSCSPDQNIRRNVSPDEVLEIQRQIQSSFEDAGLELHSFKISWYNDKVAPEYLLNYHGDTLAFLVISTPSMFEKAFLPFLAEFIQPSSLESNSVYFDPIDKCMQHYFESFKKQSSAVIGSPVECIHDFEMHMPQRRPKILLQTAAHVSGAAYYYKTQTTKQCLGVCIHPLYGGWFGIRGAFILPNILAPELLQKEAANVVPEDKQTELLHLFNDRWKDMTYRNIIPTQNRYSSLQIEYFSLKPRDRIEFIKSSIFPILDRYKLSADDRCIDRTQHNEKREIGSVI